MFISVLIKNFCFFGNTMLMKFVTCSYKCYNSCNAQPEEDDADKSKSLHILRTWGPWFVLAWLEVYFIANTRFSRGKAFFDAALICQTLLLIAFTLSMFAVNETLLIACRDSYIDKRQPICQHSPIDCVSTGFLLGFVVVTFCSKFTREFVAEVEDSLCKWAPQEYADRPQTPESEERSSTTEPGEQPETVADDGESPPGREEQPGVSPAEVERGTSECRRRPVEEREELPVQ